jgi:hypothetical protein
MATKPIAAPSVTAPAVVVELTKEQLLAKIAELEAKNALPRSPYNVVIDTNVPCKSGTCAFLTVTTNEPDYEKRTVLAKYILGDGRTRVLESGAKRTHFYAEPARQSEPEQMF